MTVPVLIGDPGLADEPCAPRTRRRGARRWFVRAAALALVVLLLPVPWRHHMSDDPPGLAWRLSGRLHVEGRAIDPPGRWTWLTVGRPPLVGELAVQRLRGGPVARDMRGGSVASRPDYSDPIAVAVGLNAAGAGLPMTILVEAVGATHPDLPDPVVLTRLNGIDLVDRDSIDRARERPRGSTWFWTADGTHHQVEGLEVPYLWLDVSDVAPADLDARIGSDHPVLQWVRNLASGSSHGLIVALMTYADASGEDLSRGRHVAGTGRMLGDGKVGRIGGLSAKAAAARRAGADVLVYPSVQAAELAGFEPGSMELIGVATIVDAIDALVSEAAPVQAAP